MGVYPCRGTGLITPPVFAIRLCLGESAVAEVKSKAITVQPAARMWVSSSWILPEVDHVLADVFQVEAVVHKDDVLVRPQVHNLSRNICYGWLTGTSSVRASFKDCYATDLHAQAHLR
jgi:hypothetical protein